MPGIAIPDQIIVDPFETWAISTRSRTDNLYIITGLPGTPNKITKFNLPGMDVPDQFFIDDGSLWAAFTIKDKNKIGFLDLTTTPPGKNSYYPLLLPDTMVPEKVYHDPDNTYALFTAPDWSIIHAIDLLFTAPPPIVNSPPFSLPNLDSPEKIYLDRLWGQYSLAQINQSDQLYLLDLNKAPGTPILCTQIDLPGVDVPNKIIIDPSNQLALITVKNSDDVHIINLAGLLPPACKPKEIADWSKNARTINIPGIDVPKNAAIIYDTTNWTDWAFFTVEGRDVVYLLDLTTPGSKPVKIDIPGISIPEFFQGEVIFW
jgi:hypothetical protein